MSSIPPHQPTPQGRVTDADLLAMPTDWRFCPVDGNKNPDIGGRDWYDKARDKDADFYLSLNGSRPVALGLLLGNATGTLAVDRDNEGWREAFKVLTKHDIDELPKTIAWTSGKPGRMQQAYTVPKEWQPLIRTRKGKNAQGLMAIELRWQGLQSVIVGAHPETGGYRWVEGCSPQELGDPAEAPEWLLEAMVRDDYTNATEYLPSSLDEIRDALAILTPAVADQGQYLFWVYVTAGLTSAVLQAGGTKADALALIRAHSPQFKEARNAVHWKPDRGTFQDFFWRAVEKQAAEKGIPFVSKVAAPAVEPIPIELLQPGPPADRLRQRFNVARETSPATPVILSAETPGFGKTRLVAPFSRLIRADGIKLVIYVSPHYRSPSDPALALWATTKARHRGLVERLVNGFPKVTCLRRGEKLELIEPATCKFSHVLDQLAAQGVSAEGRAEWCRECTENPFCPFVAQQKQLVSDIQQGKLQQLRTTPTMLPAIKEWAGKERWVETVVVIDEAPQLLDTAVQQHVISYAQLRQWTHYIMHNDMVTGKELLIDLVRILVNMPQRFEEEDAKIKKNTYELYGFDVQETAAELVEWKERAGSFFDGWHLGLIDQIELPTTDDPDAEVDLRIPLLLPHLIRAALNADGTSLSCDPKGINIYEPADDVRNALNASAGVLILDGTTDPADVRTWAAADPASFAAVRSSEDTGLQNVEIVQVHRMGTMSSSPRPGRAADRDVFIAHATQCLMQHLEKTEPKVGVIDHKKFARQGMGCHHADTRGTNAFADADALIIVGLPLKALSPVKAQFATAHAIPFADTGFGAAFSAWYERRLAEDLLQTIHRLRPLRRAGQNLTAWILSDRNLPALGAPIATAQASAFSPLLGSAAHCGLHHLADLLNSRPDYLAFITQDQAATLLHQFLASQPATRSAASTPASLKRKIQRHLKDARLSWRQFLHAQTWCADTWASP